MKTKIMALILATMMTLCALGAFAEGDVPAEHMDFTAAYIDYGSPAVEDEAYHYFLDRFNMDIEMVGLSQASYIEQNTIAISGGNMQDWTQWDFDYNQYLLYVDQGMLKALPDGWEERWPNVYKMAEASGILPALEIDGKVYAIPHGINVNLVEGKSMNHSTMYYRADWAKQVGIEIGDQITLDEFVEYIKAVEDAGLTKSGINGNTGNVQHMIMYMYAPYFTTFRKVDGQYIWGPAGEGVIDGIKKIKELYQDGVIDPDYYLNDNIAARDQFTSGISATYRGDGTIANYELLNQNALAGGIEDYHDAIKCTVITADDGKVYCDEVTNYWTALIFSPNLSDEKLERALDMTDFVISLEGELVVNLGIPEVDWTTDENGDYVILREANADGTYEEIKNIYNSLYFFWFQGILPDEFGFISPTQDPVVKERIGAMYAIRSSSDAYIPLDLDYTFFAGEAKSQYSVDVDAEIARIVADPGISLDDIEGEWNAFIESYRNIWEPVVEELNAAFAE